MKGFWPVRLGSVVAAVGVCLLIDLIANRTFSTYNQGLLILAAIYVTLAVSLNLVNGITGQFSIGHAAFYQVGAYTTMVLAEKFKAPAGLPPAVWLVCMMIASAVVAAIAGLAVGLPSLRLKGDYLAIVTLGFGEIVRIFVQNQPSLGSSYGKNITPKFQIIWLTLMLAVVTVAVCRNLLKTAHGLPFLAVREDETAALAMGVNVTRTKVVAFALGSAFAGAAGAVYGHFYGFIGPSQFTMDLSFIIVTMVVLGGTGSITGSVVAAILLFYLPEKMRDLNNISLSGVVGAALALIAAVVVLRRIGEHYHGSLGGKTLRVVGTIIGGIVLSLILGAILKAVPSLQGQVEGSKLRLVVFAVTLLVLMLLRPQGIFGHHEFSWDWLKGRRRPEVHA